MKRYFQLYDVASDYSLSPVPGKYQFGDLAHAKQRAQSLVNAWVSKMKRRPAKLSAYKIKWTRSAASGTRPDALMEWNGSIHDNELVYKIIKRSKNPVKKKRSAKQLANDRRLGRMAKARAKKKRGGRRKVTKRKVTKRNPHATRRKTKRRTKLAKSHLWSIFKCYGKSVRFLGLTTAGKLQWTIRDAAIILKSKERAAKIAKKVSKKRGMANYNIGVASRETSEAQIAAQCSAGKE